MAKEKELTQSQKLDQIIKNLAEQMKIISSFSGELSGGVTENHSEKLEEIKDSSEDIIKQLDIILPQVEQIFNLQRSELTTQDVVLKSLSDISAKLEEQEKKITWIDNLMKPVVILVFWLALIGFLGSKGCRCNGNWLPTPNPIPNPAPTEKIICNSKAEYNVILSALNIVEREQQNDTSRDLQDALDGLDSLMGGPQDGVDQKVQDRILVEFTGGREFFETIEYIRKNLEVKQ